jgi:cytidylate kinase
VTSFMGMLITIDGPAGSGKSTVSRKLSEKLGIPFLDTGALYRALAFFLHRKNVPSMEGPVLDAELAAVTVKLKTSAVLVNGEDVTQFIRSPRVDAVVSAYAALPSLRRKLLDLQRDQAGEQGLIADGRDMGTVVFPWATLKIFLTASQEERALRRWKELRERGESCTLEEVLEEVRRRDRIDSEREVAPLRAAPDAVILDTDGLSIEEVVQRLLDMIAARRNT